MKTKTATRTKGSTSPAKASSSSKPMSKKEQKNANGGGLLDDDSSSLGIVGGLGVNGSHTDEDGQTESGSLGTNFGSGILSSNKD